MPARYILQVASSGLSVVIGVNRAQSVVDTTGRGVTVILPVNDWIMPSDNKLSILIARPEAPDPGEPAAHVADVDPSLDVHLFIADPTSKMNDVLLTLVRFRWPLPAPAPVATPLPFIADVPFKVADAPPTLLWTEAPTLGQLENADRLEIVGLVERLRDAVDRRDVDGAYALMEYKFRDSARADGVDYAALAQSIRELFTDMFAEPVLIAEPMTVARAATILVGGERVVLVSRGLTRDALQFVTGTEAGKRRKYGFKLYVAKIKGRWTIVR